MAVSEIDDAADRAGNVVQLLALQGGENKGAYLVLEKLQPGGNKSPYATAQNAGVILAHDPVFSGMLGFNEFTGEYLLLRAPPPSEQGRSAQPGPYPREWKGEDVTLILQHIQRIWCPKMTKSAVEDAMIAEASARRFHPIRDWLATLRHDGVMRLDTWLPKAFGCEESEYTAAVGAKWMIAAVRRVRQPGVKFDCMPILEGDQGLGKSQAVKALAGENWFSDSMHHDLGHKDAPISLVGVWIMELAEIQQIIRAEMEVCKAFMTRGKDRYRPPYGKAAINVPRQSVLVGTTNETDYLRDSTGNRRWWPIRCAYADHDWITQNREQLWAEAAAREAAGESLWIDDADTLRSAEQAQSDRLSDDSWSGKVFDYIGMSRKVAMADVLSHGLQLAMKDQDKRAEMRVANILRKEKWRARVFREGRRTPRYWLHPEWKDE